MREIEPKKGISQRLVVGGLSEKNYILMFIVYMVAFFAFVFFIRLLIDKKISFNLFFLTVVFSAAAVFFLRFFLQKKTEKDNSKTFPKEDVRIINKNFR